MTESNIEILNTEILSENWYSLKNVTFSAIDKKGILRTQSREIYDKGNGATILLYNSEKKTIILTRQFRIPTYLNGNKNGMLIETCAGMLDNDSPEDCIRRETEEETGYKILNVKKVFEAYMSPGSVTELLHFFIGEYTPQMKASEGGGLEKDNEIIDVLEMSFDQSLKMIESGEIKDAKTLILLQYAKIHILL